MGKSEFLEQDLIPAARRCGLLTAYLNLWGARDHPRDAWIAALARAGSARGIAALFKTLKRPLKKVKASGKISGFAEGTLEAELADGPNTARLALSDLLRSFDHAKRTLRLVLDEAQVLASQVHSGLAHALRAGLDIRKQTIKVVFAGSSELHQQTRRRMHCDAALLANLRLYRVTVGDGRHSAVRNTLHSATPSLPKSREAPSFPPASLS